MQKPLVLEGRNNPIIIACNYETLIPQHLTALEE